MLCPQQPNDWSVCLPQASGDALDLLGRMLCLDPQRRISAAEALAHPYFANNPPPTPPALLPRPLKREDAPLASGAPAGAGKGELPPGCCRLESCA